MRRSRPEQREEIWSWGVAQLLVLMWEHGVTTMKRVHGKESDEELVSFMLEGLRETLDRFFTIEDTTARVLGGGVSLRYEGRLVPTYDTVNAEIFQTGWTEGCPQELLLEEAGLDFEELKATLGTWLTRRVLSPRWTSARAPWRRWKTP
jgi:hypothetical protein